MLTTFQGKQQFKSCITSIDKSQKLSIVITYRELKLNKVINVECENVKE